MQKWAITGGASGIGAATRDVLRAAGGQVIVIDIKDADIVADLMTVTGREHACNALAKLAPDGLDGFVACAGVGPALTPPSRIDRLNYFGAVASIEGARALVARKRGAIVAVSSNSAPLPGLDQSHIAALLAGDEEKACALVDALDGHNAYAGSKNALAKWVRRNAPAYMADGVRLNAIAPGMTRTALTMPLFDDPRFSQAMNDFKASIPFGDLATPDMIADVIVFLLSNAARFVSGVVLFADGGQDALLRPDQF